MHVKKRQRVKAQRRSIRLLRDWNGHKKGTVLRLVPRGQANLMIDKGIAKPSRKTKDE